MTAAIAPRLTRIDLAVWDETVGVGARHLPMHATSTPPTTFHYANLPPIRRPLRRLAIGAGLLVGAIAALVGGVYLHARLTPQHVVLVDNGNSFAVDVEVAGDQLHVAPHATASVRVHDGTLRVTATGPAGQAEARSLELPATGWNTGGRVAVYNVLGGSQLALVAVTYGTVHDAPPPITPVPRTDHLVLAPAGVAGAIDEPFPREVEISNKRWGALLWHVCRVDADDQLGCAGVADEDVPAGPGR